MQELLERVVPAMPDWEEITMTARSMATRILLADDHRIIREGLRSLIDKRADMEVVDEAQDGIEAVRLTEKFLPDVVLMDIEMPHMNGVEATRRIVGKLKNVRILALSMHSNKRFVLQMLQAGASGYLLKECAFEDLITAIKTVSSGQIYLSKKVAGVVVDECLHVLPESKVSPHDVLSPREREILQLLAEGNAAKHIAAFLNISIKTIQTHRNQIMKKLRMRSVAELTKYAVKVGLTSLEQ
jgi:DNA-binding NarL/FixJ family response regulator